MHYTDATHHVKSNFVVTFRDPFDSAMFAGESPARRECFSAMSNVNKHEIQIGYQVFIKDGGEEVGAVRDLLGGRPEILVYVENAGDFTVPLAAIKAVHSQKVIVDQAQLPEDMRVAVRHAHDAESV
jgi:hypothetical protein